MSPTNQMAAVLSEQYGSPSDTLRFEHVSIPVCSSKEILVQVKYTSVTRTDCGFLRAKPFIVRFFAGLLKPTNPILGCEFAGVVVKLGEDVSQFSVGDQVIGFKDDDYGFGGHAQFTSMHTDGMIAHIPESVPIENAVAALEGGHYALADIRAAKISPGSRVLVNGATGAIGSAAVQILIAMGAEVTAVCAGPSAEKIQALGASKMIDYLKEDFTQLPGNYDMVFDAVGKSTFGQCKRILSANGIYVSTELGPMAQNPFLAFWTHYVGKQKVLFPIPKNEKKDAEYLLELMETNRYQPLIDRTYQFDQIVEAYEYVERGEKIGNVLIEMRQPA